MNTSGSNNNMFGGLGNKITDSLNGILKGIDLSNVKSPEVKVGLDTTTIAVIFIVLLAVLRKIK
jgi:hypothetical protein